MIISLAPTDTDPEISDWIVQLVDISQRIVVERLLEEEAQYNQRILNAVLDGIITLDSKGIICSANPAACKIFGISADKLIDQCIDTIVQKADSGNIIQHYLSQSELPAVTDIAAGLNSNINTEIVAFTGNGLAIPIDFQLSSINRKQEKIFIAVIRDLSEQKRLEQLKNDFISTTSHELRTPLTSILGSLKLLECGSLGDMTEPVKKLIKIANQNGQKLTLLINDLLDMDKLLSGQMQFDLQVQPLKPLVILALENIGVYAQQYQVGLTLENAATEFLVNVDGQRLQQVLTNLLSNAAKFSPQGGQVTVNIKPVNNRVRIEVIDCGMGISAEGQKKLFTKFYQVDSSSTRKAGGTGLGLAISKELIEAMQGTIGVSSELGKGSCFYVDLPIAS